MRATKTECTTRRWMGALLAALLLAAAIPVAAAPADLATDVAERGAVTSLWHEVVAWVVGLVQTPPADAGPPADSGPDVTGTQSLEDCGTPAECEGGVDIEPHG